MAKREQPSVEIDEKYQEEVEEALRKENTSSPEGVMGFLKESFSKFGDKAEKYWGRTVDYFRTFTNEETKELQEEGLGGVERVEKVVAESAESGVDASEEITEFKEDMVVIDKEAEEAKKNIDNLIDELSADLEQKHERKPQEDKDFAKWARERAEKAKEEKTFDEVLSIASEKKLRDLRGEVRRKEARLKKARTELARSPGGDKELLEFKISLLGKQVADIKQNLEGALHGGKKIKGLREEEEFEEKAEDVEEKFMREGEWMDKIMEALSDKKLKKLGVDAETEAKVLAEIEEYQEKLSFSAEDYFNALVANNKKQVEEYLKEYYDVVPEKAAKIPLPRKKEQKIPTAKASIRGEQ